MDVSAIFRTLVPRDDLRRSCVAIQGGLAVVRPKSRRCSMRRSPSASRHALAPSRVQRARRGLMGLGIVAGLACGTQDIPPAPTGSGLSGAASGVGSSGSGKDATGSEDGGEGDGGEADVACCLVEPDVGTQCVNLGPTTCASMGGAPQPAASSCELEGCAGIDPGACCDSNAGEGCVSVSEQQCGGLGGTFQGAGTTCPAGC